MKAPHRLQKSELLTTAHTVLLALLPAVSDLLPLIPHAPAVPRDLQLPEDSIDSAQVAPAAWMSLFSPLLLASLYGDTQVSRQFLREPSSVFSGGMRRLSFDTHVILIAGLIILHSTCRLGCLPYQVVSSLRAGIPTT